MREKAVMIIALFLSIMFSVNVLAAVPSFEGLPACGSSNVGQTLSLNYSNGCGKATFQCVYRKCSPGVQCFFTGYTWNKVSCDVPGTGVCCGYSDWGCGYNSAYTMCSPCKQCGGYGGCDVNVADSSSCSSSGQNGKCYIGDCDVNPPQFNDNQGDINLSDKASSTYLNVGMSDDVGLKEVTIKACKRDDCSSETVNLSGKSYSGLELPSALKLWIDQKAAPYSTFSISLKMKDLAGNENEISPFMIIGEDVPKIDIDAIGSLEVGQKAKINARVTEKLSGLESVDLYVDGALTKSCLTETCSYEYIPSSGSHSYKITAEDNAGNIGEKEGTFNVAGTEKTCSQIGGKICGSDERCMNGNMVETTDSEECCISSCYSAELNLTCSAQNGIIYDPAVKRCSVDIPATDVLGENRCCATLPSDITAISSEKKTYWMDSIGNKLSGAGLQENVRCIASGNPSSLSVIKDDTVLEESKESEIGIKVESVGSYSCKAVYADGSSKESALKITELPAPVDTVRARLPGFGWVQMAIASMLIFAYYIISRKR